MWKFVKPKIIFFRKFKANNFRYYFLTKAVACFYMKWQQPALFCVRGIEVGGKQTTSAYLKRFSRLNMSILKLNILQFAYTLSVVMNQRSNKQFSALFLLLLYVKN
jgi:hypothetical protein